MNRAPVSPPKSVSEAHWKPVPKSQAGEQFVLVLSVLILGYFAN